MTSRRAVLAEARACSKRFGCLSVHIGRTLTGSRIPVQPEKPGFESQACGKRCNTVHFRKFPKAEIERLRKENFRLKAEDVGKVVGKLAQIVTACEIPILVQENLPPAIWSTCDQASGQSSSAQAARFAVTNRQPSPVESQAILQSFRLLSFRIRIVQVGAIMSSRPKGPKGSAVPLGTTSSKSGRDGTQRAATICPGVTIFLICYPELVISVPSGRLQMLQRTRTKGEKVALSHKPVVGNDLSIILERASHRNLPGQLWRHSCWRVCKCL